MTIGTTLDRHPVVAALCRIGEAIGEARDAVWSLGDDDVLDSLDAHEAVSAMLAALGLDLAATADVRGVAAGQGAPSTLALLRDRLRLHPGEAKSRVELATDPGLTATRAALGTGEISLAHARVVAQAVPGLPADRRGEAEDFLVGQARVFDPGQLHKLARHLRHVLAPDRAEAEERAAVDRRELSLYDRGDGTHALRGILDNEATARLMAALDPLSAPAPAADGTPDPRSPKRRRADALTTLVDWVLDDGRLVPGSRGARPHVTITADLATLVRLPGARAADVAWGGPVSAETLRRMACDAGVTFVLTDHLGVPLDVGREHRIVTPGIWAALVVRDGGCTFPGCTRPWSWCEAHHVIHWCDHGPTKLDNLTLLCAHHHRVVHHDGWRLQFGPDRRPEYVPPPWIDPEQRPRRNNYWRIQERFDPPDGR